MRKTQIVLFGLLSSLAVISIDAVVPSLEAINRSMNADMTTLAIYRALQAVGAGGASALMVLLISDRCGLTDTARFISLTLIVSMAVRISAPIAGYQITYAHGWQSLFLCLALIGTLLTIYFSLPSRKESHNEKKRPFTLSGVLRDFQQILSDRQSRLYIGAEIATSLGLFAYVTSASSVMINYLDISPQNFSFVFAGGTALMMAGAHLNNRMVARIALDRLMLFASIPLLVISASLMILLMAGLQNKTLIASLILSFLLPMMMVRINANTGCIKRFPKAAGAASSLHNASGLIAGAAAGTLCGTLLGGTPTALAFLLLTSALASLLCAGLLVSAESSQGPI